ncbi:UNVERIFIED_CONTAM: hypothetical protein H355_017050 [Colinus virginianus]|nr:hypothetical protein H355_017050 [Colinus virginianus]
MGSVRAGAVRDAAERLRGRVHRTPVLTCGALQRLAGRRLLFKCELFQRTGSFKIRGALNAVGNLVEEAERAGRERPRAVVTHSSGNHGQALACAAREEGIPAYVVVPRTAPCCKQAAIRAYGATLVPCEPSDESRAETAARVVQETGGVMVHPNQEPAVIAGQGTIALEVLEQAPEVNALVVPVGGGGMIAGIAVAVKRATRLVWERMKLLIEPTAGVGVAAVLSEQFQAVPREVENVCIVLCGGNVDLSSLTWLTDLPGDGE